MNIPSRAAIVAVTLSFALAACNGTEPDTGTSTTPAPDKGIDAEATPVFHDATPADSSSAPEIDTKVLAGTFKGTLPCASCPGIDTVLHLRPDGGFAISEQYQNSGKAGSTDKAALELQGSWSVEGSRVRLDPDAKDEQDRLFQLLPPDQLRLLDSEGQPIAGEPDHGLTRVAGDT